MRQPAWTRQWWQSKEINNVCKLKKKKIIRIYLACVFICLVSLFHTRKDTFGFDTLELDFKTTRPRNTNDDTISCSNHWLAKIVFQFRHKTWKSYPFKWHNPFDDAHILDINVVINWQLSYKVYRVSVSVSVSLELIAGSGVDPSRSSIFWSYPLTSY